MSGTPVLWFLAPPGPGRNQPVVFHIVVLPRVYVNLGLPKHRLHKKNIIYHDFLQHPCLGLPLSYAKVLHKCVFSDMVFNIASFKDIGCLVVIEISSDDPVYQ